MRIFLVVLFALSLLLLNVSASSASSIAFRNGQRHATDVDTETDTEVVDVKSCVKSSDCPSGWYCSLPKADLPTVTGPKLIVPKQRRQESGASGVCQKTAGFMELASSSSSRRHGRHSALSQIAALAASLDRAESHAPGCGEAGPIGRYVETVFEIVKANTWRKSQGGCPSDIAALNALITGRLDNFEHTAYGILTRREFEQDAYRCGSMGAKAPEAVKKIIANRTTKMPKVDEKAGMKLLCEGKKGSSDIIEQQLLKNPAHAKLFEKLAIKLEKAGPPKFYY